jgi:peptidoglycan/LPS O-acetylase OafA/YrhL
LNITNRIYGLDILRSFAVLAVVFSHSIWLIYGFFKPNSIGDSLFIFTASSFGYIGVEIFFVLSGFLIGSSFIKEIVQSSELQWQSIKLFLIKRWFRTLPNYYLYVLLYLFIYWRMDWPGIEDFSWKYLIFVHNFLNTGPGFIYVAWSLAVEEWFYFLLPLFFATMFLLFKNKKWSFLITVFLLFLIPFVSRFIYVIQHFEDKSFTLMLGFATIYRLDSIAYGVYFALLWSNLSIQNKLLKYKRILFYLSIFSFLGFLVYMGLFISKPIQNPLLVLISYPLLSLIITLSFPYMTSLTFNKPNYIKRGITFLSLISYSLYLAHPIFIKFFDSLRHQYKPSFMISCLYWIATITSSILFSYCTYILCEKRFLQWRDRLILKNSPKRLNLES